MWHSRVFGVLTATVLLPPSTYALELLYVSHLDLHNPEIGLTEPSGLAVDPDGSGFWLVSDEERTVFRLEANGALASYIGRDNRLRDLEGVAVDAEAGRLLVVSEQTASIISLGIKPPHRMLAVNVAALPAPAELSGLLEDQQNGLEGIAVHPDTGAVVLLKEDAPRLLIEINPQLDKVLTVRSLDDVLPEGQDISGVAVDTARDGLWIVSDKGRSVHFLPDSGDARDSMALIWRDGSHFRRLDNPEGVALSPDGESLFVVTDDGRNSRIVQYSILETP